MPHLKTALKCSTAQDLEPPATTPAVAEDDFREYLTVIYFIETYL